MSSEFTFGDNSDEFSFSEFFLNLADRDLSRVSDHSDADVVMTARTSGTDKVNQTGKSLSGANRNILLSM